jgi:nucleotide-binding universal stress UspA family protein
MAAGFEKIVVGFDRTDRGRDALVLGELLGRYTSDEFLLARVEPAQEEGQTRCFANEISGLAGASQLVAKPLPLVGSSPSRALHELAETDREVGLIVLGSTHRAGLGRVMPGSVAERLKRGSVLCGRSPARLCRYRRERGE